MDSGNRKTSMISMSNGSIVDYVVQYTHLCTLIVMYMYNCLFYTFKKLLCCK